MKLTKIADEDHFVSEPNPSWFGNAGNIKSDSWTCSNWLKSRFHFSFAEYSNPHKNSFGVLRVMNDDLVQADRGFGQHPHQNMEIVTYIIEGHLTHQDSMGTSETLTRGSVQFMSAGTGVRHSEHNLDKKSALRFIQMWIVPRRRGLTPNYGSYEGNEEDRKDKWLHLVGDVNNEKNVPVKVQQDVNMFVTEISKGKTLELTLQPARQAYILCMEGGVSINDVVLERHDSMTAVPTSNEKTNFRFSTSKDKTAHILVVEMEAD